MVKDDWPPTLFDCPEFTRILKFRLILQMVKDDWSPNPLSTGPRSLPEILKFRLILHMVKDGLTPKPPINCSQDFTRNF